jgi:hypothetical protein
VGRRRVHGLNWLRYQQLTIPIIDIVTFMDTGMMNQLHGHGAWGEPGFCEWSSTGERSLAAEGLLETSRLT